MTRSGCTPRIASTFGRIPSPREGTSVAESGQRSYLLRPTRRDPAPMVKSISVVAGLSETMRVGGATRLTESPKSSSTALVRDGVLPQPVATATATSIESRKRERKNKNGHSSQRNARNEHAQKRLTATRTSLRGSAKVARTKVVSWLRAVRLTFPAAPAASGVTSRRLLPVTVAGPHRH